MSTNAAGSTDRTALLAGAFLLVSATLAAYWPALHGGFLFDDDSMVTGSALVHASDGLRRMWLSADAIDYWPLTNSSLWIEWRLWGADSTGYHVTNVLLHGGSALLLWAILRRLAVPGAWIAAMIFALHPVNVQSVAWISQRKNTLSMLWFLVAIFWFLRSLDRRVRDSGTAATTPHLRHKRKDTQLEGRRFRSGSVWYALSLLAFLFAMLSKGSVAILPGVLLLLIWWVHGRITRRDLARVAPFLVIAVGLTLVNIWFQQRMPGGARDVTVLERLLGAGGVIWFYLAKAVAPFGLTFIYPQWSVSAAEAHWWAAAAGATGVTAVLAWKRDRPIARALLLAWLFFCLALVPVMGFTDVYFMTYSLVADHYQYIAMLAVAATVGAVLGFRGSEGPRFRGVWGYRLAAAAVVIALGVLTWRQAHLYASGEALYRATLEANPDAWAVRNNLGAILLDREANDEALVQLRETVRLNPEARQARNNLCTALERARLMDEAIGECRRALIADPDRAPTHYSLGVALASRGELTQARTELERAVRLNPGSAQSHAYLAELLHATNGPAAAVPHYREALRLRPDWASAHAGFGRALAELGDAPGAERAVRDAIRLDPSVPDFHRDLGDLLVALGRAEEAVAAYRQALSRDGRSAEAHNNLGVALARAGRTAEAIDSFRAAVALDPAFTPAQENLDRVLRRQ